MAVYSQVKIVAVECGAESGRYVALDLGGTNFRVLLVELKARRDERPNVVSKVFLIPLKIMLGTANMASHSPLQTVLELSLGGLARLNPLRSLEQPPSSANFNPLGGSPQPHSSLALMVCFVLSHAYRQPPCMLYVTAFGYKEFF